MGFFAGKSVLVTGAGGFIGSHLTAALAAEGARVRALCHYNALGSVGWLGALPTDVREGLDVRLGDIRDGRFVDALCDGVDTVFHLAALIAIPHSYRAPESFIDTNVRGTLNVLEAARRCHVRRVVHTSTSEVYGTPEVLPITERHPLNAQSPYAATKIAADQLALSFARSFGTPVVVLRPFNTYGPRQSTRAVIPTMLTQLLAGRDEVSVGRLDTKRDFTFVGDTVRGFLRAAEAIAVDGKVVQLGTGVAVSMSELFLAACRATGAKAMPKREERRMRPDASEVLVLQSDPSLARDLLNWTPEIPLEAGLAQTAAWLKANLERYRVDFFQE